MLIRKLESWTVGATSSELSLQTWVLVQVSLRLVLSQRSCASAQSTFILSNVVEVRSWVHCVVDISWVPFLIALSVIVGHSRGNVLAFFCFLL